MEEILSTLNSGGIILYPTDTIYGIGTDINNIQGIEKINAIKNRRAPMSIVIHSFEEIAKKLIIPSQLRNKMEKIINNGDTCIVEYKSGAFNEIITKDNKLQKKPTITIKLAFFFPNNSLVISVTKKVMG